MLDQIKLSLKDCLSKVDASIDVSIDEIEVSLLFDEKGDFTTNIALKFSKLYKQKPADLAKSIIENFYTSDFVYQSRTRAEHILLFIIKFLEKDQNPLPYSWRSKIQDEDSKKQIIVDYICGMTDQYAINFYNNYA